MDTPAELRYIQFGLLSPEEIKSSTFEILHEKSDDLHGTLNDPRFGVVGEFTKKCEQCNKSMECPGHFGHIKLAYPVPNPFYINQITHLLQSMCLQCGKLRISKEDVAVSDIALLSGIQRQRRIMDECKKMKQCVWCDENLPLYSEKDGIIYSHFEIKRVKTKPVAMSFQTIYDAFIQLSNEEVELFGLNSGVIDDAAYTRYDNLPDKTVEHRHAARPEWMFITVLPVVPHTVRLPGYVAGRMQVDDLDSKYSSVLSTNAFIRDHNLATAGLPVPERKGKKQNPILDELELKKLITKLIVHVSTIIDNKQGVSVLPNGKPSKGLRERLDGKDGFRSLTNRKRAGGSARTVIGGAPQLQHGELGVPREIAKSLTVPERVYSRDRLAWANKLLKAGCVNFVKRGVVMINVKYAMKNPKFALRMDDIVYRHLQDGDVALFNRQPSLRAESINKVSIRIHDGKTFRMGLAMTPPFNADFDGDEMNLHVPQSYEARIEMDLIGDVHIMTSQTNAPVMGAVQNTLVGLYLLTQDSTKIQRALAYDIISHCIGEFDIVEFTKRFNKTTRRDAFINDEMSGKALFSTILPSDFNYKKKGITIVNGILIEGVITKQTAGAKSGSIIEYLYLYYSPSAAKNFITNIQWMANDYVERTNFTVGITDCLITYYASQGDKSSFFERSAKLQNKIQSEIDAGFDKCMSFLERDDAYVERDACRVLNDATNASFSTVMEHVSRTNHFYIMAESGAKGSAINIAQIGSCIGQQNITGNRPANALSNGTRASHYFAPNDESPGARGFIRSNYLGGLSPKEIIYAYQAGRNNLIEQVVGTEKTGYDGRRIGKKTGDSIVDYTGCVVNQATNTIVQFVYGNDGFEGERLQRTEEGAFFIDAKTYILKYNSGKQTKLTPKRIEELCSVISTHIAMPPHIASVEIARRKLAAQLDGCSMNLKHFNEFKAVIERMYWTSQACGGYAAGQVATTSIGEGSTQGALNAFHLAGVLQEHTADRFTELICATQNPSLILTVCDIKSSSIDEAVRYIQESTDPIDQEELRVACMVELLSYKKYFVHTTIAELITSYRMKSIGEYEFSHPLGELFSYDVYEPEWWVDEYMTRFKSGWSFSHDHWMIQLRFDLEKLHALNLTLMEIGQLIEGENMFECAVSPLCIGIIDVFINYGKIKSKFEQLEIEGSNETLYTSENIVYFITRDIILKSILASTACGIKGVSNIVPVEQSNKTWKIYVNGGSYQSIRNLPFVNADTCISNNVWDVMNVMGIEITREVFIAEIRNILGGGVDVRHIEILVDNMLTLGTISSVQRSGIDRDVGPLAKASYEETTTNFMEAGRNCEVDLLQSIDSCVAAGKTIKAGTGYVQLINADHDDEEEEYIVPYDEALFEL